MKKYRGDGLLKKVKGEAGIRAYLAGTKKQIDKSKLIDTSAYHVIKYTGNISADYGLMSGKEAREALGSAKYNKELDMYFTRSGKTGYSVELQSSPEPTIKENMLSEKFRYSDMRSGDWLRYTTEDKLRYINRLVETLDRYERTLRKEDLADISLAYQQYHNDLVYFKSVLKSKSYTDTNLDDMAVNLLRYIKSKTANAKGVRQREADIIDRLQTMPEDLRTAYLGAYDITNVNYKDFTNDEKKRFWEIYNRTVEYLTEDYRKAYDSNSVQALTLEMFSKFSSSMSTEEIAMNIALEI